MIRLNLLPPELKQKHRKTLTSLTMTLAPRIPVFTICFYTALGLLVIHSLLFLILWGWSFSLKGLKARWESAAEKRQQVMALRQRHEDLLTKEKALYQLTGGRPLWAKRLKGLSDGMVTGVWLRSLLLEERTLPPSLVKKVLLLEGTAASLRGDEPAMIGRFLRNLKQSSHFFSAFQEVELESMKRRQIQDVEVMDFKVICVFSEGSVP